MHRPAPPGSMGPFPQMAFILRRGEIFLASYDLYWEIHEAHRSGRNCHPLAPAPAHVPAADRVHPGAPNRGAGSRDSREDSVRPRELPLKTIRWSRHSRSMDPTLPRPAGGVLRA